MKLSDNWVNCLCTMKDFVSVPPQLHNIPHCCYSFCFSLYLTMLCCVRRCGAIEQIMYNTTTMSSAEILHCCCFLSYSASCLLEFHCCDFYDLSRHVKVECFCVLLHFMDINHWLP
jgi:hypothetical protein